MVTPEDLKANAGMSYDLYFYRHVTILQYKA